MHIVLVTIMCFFRDQHWQLSLNKGIYRNIEMTILNLFLKIMLFFFADGNSAHEVVEGETL